jgi:hypothetical protein
MQAFQCMVLTMPIMPVKVENRAEESFPWVNAVRFRLCYSFYDD